MGVIITTPTQSAPSLPVWTWAAGGATPADGTITTNATGQASTTQILMSNLSKDGAGDWATFLIGGSLGSNILVQFCDSLGNIFVFQCADIESDSNGNIQLPGTVIIQNGKNWGGNYMVSFLPVLQPVPTLSSVLLASGITPAPDATVTPVTSITTQGGITTGAS